MVKLGRKLLVVGALAFAACAPAEDGEARRPSPSPAPEPVTIAPAVSATPEPAPRDVAVLVVEESAAGLKVLSAKRVAFERLGASARFNGKGRATHRYRLVDSAAKVLDEGDVAARPDVHVPAGPAGPAAHAELPTTVFTVRAPYPAAGEHIEVVSANDQTVMVRWP